MAVVIFQCLKTGEIACTLHPEDYEGTGYELVGIEREPKDGERWGPDGWEPIEGLEEAVYYREMNRLPKAVRSLLLRQEARIYMLEQQLANLTKSG